MKSTFFFLRMCTETPTSVGNTSGGNSAALPFARTRSTVAWHALHAHMIASRVRALSNITQPIPVHILYIVYTFVYILHTHVYILHVCYIHMCTYYIYHMTQPLPLRPRHYSYYNIVCILLSINILHIFITADTASPPPGSTQSKTTRDPPARNSETSALWRFCIEHDLIIPEQDDARWSNQKFSKVSALV
jgi:uncharacterized membrane protein YecN with MAPEG domain